MTKTNIGYRWPLFLGVVGFLVGFFGPIIADPSTHQGPLLGILFTGPIGFIVGLLLWVLSSLLKWPPQTQWRIFGCCCSLFALSVIAMLLMPRPQWLGRIYEIEVVSCKPVSTDANEGSLITADIDSEKVVRKDKPLFKETKLSAFKITTRSRERYTFHFAGPCDLHPVGSKHTHFTSSENTNETGRRLNKLTLLPLPDELKGL